MVLKVRLPAIGVQGLKLVYLQPRLPEVATTMHRRPFVTPSYAQAMPVESALTGTGANLAPPAVEEITGAHSVLDCTKGAKRSSQRPFCPLPLKNVTPIKIPVLE